jgi:actin related protein 2/3 complex subunit 5
MADAFRKIDIDVYDEDVLQESELYEPDPRDPSQVISDVKQNSAKIRSSLAKCISFIYLRAIAHVVIRGDIAGALNIVLEYPPYGPNVEEAKVLILTTVR